MTKLIIFDLDGTLVDSFGDITRSVNELLASLGRRALTPEEIRGYVGNGVRRLLERSLGAVSDDELARAEALYLPIYRRRLLDSTRPYPGVVPALDALRTKPALAVLTNKPVHESRLILAGLGLDRYFRSIYGGDSFPRRKPDPTGVHHLLAETGAAPEETLFVGDSGVDVETARNAAVRSCLVDYGALVPGKKTLAADYNVRDLRELVPIVES